MSFCQAENSMVCNYNSIHAHLMEANIWCRLLLGQTTSITQGGPACRAYCVTSLAPITHTMELGKRMRETLSTGTTKEQSLFNQTVVCARPIYWKQSECHQLKVMFDPKWIRDKPPTASAEQLQVCAHPDCDSTVICREN